MSANKPTALDTMARVLADGSVLMAAVREAGAHGQWVEAAEMLERWAARVEHAVAVLDGSDLAALGDDDLVHIGEAVASAARMHSMTIEAANEAWRRAAQNGARA
jgi:hypothetical protein